MQLISKLNYEFRILLCVIDIYSKCAWIIPLKDKKGITITNAFQGISNESKGKPNKIWVDKDRDLMKSILQNNDKKIHLTHNGGKSVIAKRFIRTLKNKL